jgi:hypothetical protein
MNKLCIPWVVILGLVIHGCQGQQNSVPFDFGRFQKNIYSNSFFNLTMTVPDGWILQSRETTEDLVKEGRKLVAGEDKNLESAIESAEINTAHLFVIYQYEIGAAVDYNPSLTLVAENLKNVPGVKTGADYLFHVRRLLSQAQLKYDHIDKEFRQVDINGMTFFQMNANIHYLGYDIKQKYYTTLLKGFSLSMIISYVDGEQESILEESIDSMTFAL